MKKIGISLGKIHRRMPTLIPAILLLLILVVPSMLGELIIDMDLTRIDSSRVNLPPCAEYLLGTQSEGRDMLSLLILGTGATLKIGLVAGFIGIGAGTVLGLIAGYFGGKVDAVISVVVDSMLTIPSLAILILIAAAVRELSVTGMGIIVSLTAWMHPARVVKSQMLSLKERNYVHLARISDMGSISIIFREIMPNLIPFLAASFVNSVSSAILASIGMEVLGLGSQQTLSLGMTIYYANYYSAMWRGMWWWWLPPVIIVVLIFITLFMLSLALDELGNPKFKRI